MAKIRSTYRTYIPSGLKAKSDIPTAANISEGVDYIRCINVSRNQVMGVLGTSTTSLINLCRHDNINRWANFSPIVRSISPYQQDYSSTLVNSVPTVCRLLDFAGYNHSAETPGWWSLSSPLDVWVDSGSQASFEVYVVTGEIDFNSLFDATHIAVVLFNGSDAVQGYGQTALSGIGDGAALLTVTTIYGQALEHTDWYIVGYILNGAISDPVSDLPTNIVCKIPNCSSSTVHIHIKAASVWKYGDTGNQTLPDGWVQNGSANMNFSTGVFNIGSIANTVSKNVRVQVLVTDWLGDTVGNGYVIGPSGYITYNPGDDDLTGTIDLGDFADYGYTTTVNFLYS